MDHSSGLNMEHEEEKVDRAPLPGIRVCHEDLFGKQDTELSLKSIKSLRTLQAPQNEMSGEFDNLTGDMWVQGGVCSQQGINSVS